MSDDDDMDAFRRTMADNIRRSGRTLLGVFPSEDSDDPLNDAFTYSVGNSLVGLPELLVVGIFDGMQWPLNELSRLMIERGRKFDDGEMVSLGEGALPLCLVDASEEVKERYTVQATSFFGEENYQVMQVVLPDKDGRFPWQAECAPPYRGVKVYRRAKLN